MLNLGISSIQQAFICSIKVKTSNLTSLTLIPTLTTPRTQPQCAFLTPPFFTHVCMLIKSSIVCMLLCHVLDLSLNKEFCILYIQGVNKVRRHCSINYNFRINVHSILRLYRHTNRFNTKVRTLLPLLQLYFI